MTLPAATKDISAHPAKGSVTEPVDKAKKDRDVERKLKLYNMIQALRASRLPTNAQFDSFVNYMQEKVNSFKNDESSSLCGDTKQLFTDVNGILDAMRHQVHDKNSDELIQTFIWETRLRDIADEMTNANGDTTSKPVDKTKAKDDLTQARHHIRTLVNLFLTNSEARKLLSDFSLVGRDLLARTAQKAAGALAPDAEKLDQVDDTAPRGEFVDRDIVGETKARVKDAQAEGTKLTKDAKQEAAHAREVSASTQPATSTTGGIVSGAAGPASADKPINEDEIVEKKGFFGKLTRRVPEKHKNTATDHYHKTRKFLTEDYFPKDRRDQWIYRGKKVILECQEHTDYQESLTWLLDFVEEYLGHGRTMTTDQVKTGSDKFRSPELQHTWDNLKILLDRFANGKSLDNTVIDRLNALADDAKRDEELKTWWRNVANYVRELLLSPGYILEPKSDSDGRNLMEEGKRFYGSGKSRSSDNIPLDGEATDTAVAPQSPTQPGKYREHYDLFLEAWDEWFKGVREDPGNKDLGDSLSRFVRHMLFVEDSEGGSRFSFKGDMWGDIRRVILPVIVENVGYIPIPRIEYTDDNLDLVVENLTLSGKNLFPNLVAIEAHNYVRFSPYSAVKKSGDESRHEFIVTLSQMQADMRDVAFYFEKKSGIPKLKDSGLADVVVGGDGVHVTIHLASANNDPRSFFQVKNVAVKIDSLKFSIRDSKHDLLYKTLKPLATVLVKRQIVKAIRNGIETGLGVLDDQLVSVRDKMEEAKNKRLNAEGEDKPGRLAGLQEVFKRSRSVRSKDGSSIASESPTSSQFKVVSNKRNSILAHKGHPAGWVNRAVDKEGIESETDGWKTDVFNVKRTPVAGSA